MQRGAVIASAIERAVGVVFPSECDVAVGQGHETVVGNGHAVRVAGCPTYASRVERHQNGAMHQVAGRFDERGEPSP
jgi:hypothetical protein